MVNKKTSLYLDTSVIGGYYDVAFQEDTRLLFQNIRDGIYTVFISTLTQEELKEAPEKVRDVLNELEYQQIDVSPECRALADEYIRENVVGATSKNDCVHIAAATINNIDVLVSWNFKHIVNFQRIKGYNSVNIKSGYRLLEIRSPKDMEIL